MSHEQNVGKSEKKLITTAAAIGLSAAALTGCGIGDYGASSAETPNPAAVAEQEAVNLVDEYSEHPEKFDGSAIVRIGVPVVALMERLPPTSINTDKSKAGRANSAI